MISNLTRRIRPQNYSHGRNWWRVCSSLSGTNAQFMEDMYNKWCLDPGAVDSSWGDFFQARGGQRCVPTPSKSPIPSGILSEVEKYLTVHKIIRKYQNHGHFVADLNPLLPIKPAKIGMAGDIPKTFSGSTVKLPAATFVGGTENELLYDELVARLEKTYCGKIGAEFCHIKDPEQYRWIAKKMEDPKENSAFTKEDKMRFMERVTAATLFEKFLMTKYPAEKRFGIEGCDCLIPSVKEIIDVSVGRGVESFIFGMAHRGRLNVMINVCHAPLAKLLPLFKGFPFDVVRCFKLLNICHI